MVSKISLQKMREKEQRLSWDALISELKYDHETGQFIRLKYRGSRSATPAGQVSTRGYRDIIVQGTRYVAHRLAWFYVTKKWPTIILDHINGDKDDNRFCNLREATIQQNAQNRGALTRSGLKGVYLCRSGRWRAEIRVDGRVMRIGTFATKEHAASAYAEVAKATRGEFARFV